MPFYIDRLDNSCRNPNGYYAVCMTQCVMCVVGAGHCLMRPVERCVRGVWKPLENIVLFPSL